jgi:predicted Fe-S protein YdhL (DUF1289 family)
MKPNDAPGSWHRLVAEQKRHVLTACGRRKLKIDSREETSDTPPKREQCRACDRSGA